MSLRRDLSSAPSQVRTDARGHRVRFEVGRLREWPHWRDDELARDLRRSHRDDVSRFGGGLQLRRGRVGGESREAIVRG